MPIGKDDFIALYLALVVVHEQGLAVAEAGVGDERRHGIQGMSRTEREKMKVTINAGQRTS